MADKKPVVKEPEKAPEPELTDDQKNEAVRTAAKERAAALRGGSAVIR